MKSKRRGGRPRNRSRSAQPVKWTDADCRAADVRTAASAGVAFSISSTSWSDRIAGTHPCRVDLDSHRSPQQRNRDDHPAAVPRFHDDAFGASQRTGFDAHALTGLQERPRLDREARVHDALDGGNLFGGYGHGAPAVADDAHDTRRRDDLRHRLARRATEDVSREERAMDLLDSIRPSARLEKAGQEDLVPAHPE